MRVLLSKTSENSIKSSKNDLLNEAGWIGLVGHVL